MTTYCHVRWSFNASRRLFADVLIFFCALLLAISVTFRSPIRSRVMLQLWPPDVISPLVYLKHTVGGLVHGRPDRRDKVHPKKCVILTLDLRGCSLLLPSDPSVSFSYFFFYPRLLLPAHHFSLHTTLAYPLLSLPRLSLCLSQLPVCLILNPVEIGQAE